MVKLTMEYAIKNCFGREGYIKATVDCYSKKEALRSFDKAFKKMLKDTDTFARLELQTEDRHIVTRYVNNNGMTYFDLSKGTSNIITAEAVQILANAIIRTTAF